MRIYSRSRASISTRNMRVPRRKTYLRRVEKRSAFHRFVLRRPVLRDHTVECASLWPFLEAAAFGLAFHPTIPAPNAIAALPLLDRRLPCRAAAPCTSHRSTRELAPMRRFATRHSRRDEPPGNQKRKTGCINAGIMRSTCRRLLPTLVNRLSRRRCPVRGSSV
jgi:hypothetical protein